MNRQKQTSNAGTSALTLSSSSALTLASGASEPGDDQLDDDEPDTVEAKEQKETDVCVFECLEQACRP